MAELCAAVVPATIFTERANDSVPWAGPTLTIKKMDEAKVGFCNNFKHTAKRCGYARDAVPLHMLTKRNGALLKQCSVCRASNNVKTRRHQTRRKKAIAAISTETRHCHKCAKEYVDHKGKYVYCVDCRRKRKVHAKTRIETAYRTVLLQRIHAMGACCNVCKKVFLKADVGFRVVDSLAGVTDEMLELYNVEFDHLTEDEQVQQFGQSFGPKTGSIAKLGSLASMEHEARKCQLVCLRCHAKETARRWTHKSPQRSIVVYKRQILAKIKLEVAVCNVCNAPVDRDNLAYHEFDHLDPKMKVAAIATMCYYSTYSVMEMLDELEKCRMVCRFCHRKHTRETNRFNGILGPGYQE
jgi:hypothetical protein